MIISYLGHWPLHQRLQWLAGPSLKKPGHLGAAGPVLAIGARGQEAENMLENMGKICEKWKNIGKIWQNMGVSINWATQTGWFIMENRSITR